MSFLLQTAWKDLRRRLRDPLALLLWIGIPLAIGALISLAFGGTSSEGPKAEVWVVDQDDSLLSGFLLSALASGEQSGLPLRATEVDLEDGQGRINAGDGSALLIIPEGFGSAVMHEEPCVLRLLTNPAQSILPNMVEQSLRVLVDLVFYVHRALGTPIQRILEEAEGEQNTLPDLEVAQIAVLINQAIARAERWIAPPVIELKVLLPEQQSGEAGAGSDPATGFAELFFPSMLFMALFFMAQGISEDFWVERDQGTLHRALVTPHGVASLLGGKLLGAGLLTGAVGLVGLLLARFAFDVQVQNFALAALWATLSGAGLLLLILPLQLFASSQKAGGLLTNLVMMPLLMLGGSFFPFDAMPEGMAAIGRLTPNGWMLSEFQGIVLNDFGWSSLGWSALAMAGLGSLLFALAVRRLSGPFGGQ